MFDRFNEQARLVVVSAQDESRALKHDHIGTEHFLLALFRKEAGIAPLLLEACDLSVADVREKVVAVVGEGERVVTGQIPFTPHAKKVMEGALREALSLGHNYVGSEHILLGLVQTKDSLASRILSDAQVDRERIRDEIVRMLTGPGGKPRSSGSRVEGSQYSVERSSGARVNLAYLVFAPREAKEALIARQDFERAAHLRNQQRRLERLAEEVQADLSGLDAAVRPPSPDAAEAARWQYDVKTLEGSSDAWAAQLTTWRRDGWELLAVVPEGEVRRAILERRV